MSDLFFLFRNYLPMGDVPKGQKLEIRNFINWFHDTYFLPKALAFIKNN